MTNSASAVTPARFAQGLPWEDYLTYIASPENLARPAPGFPQRPDSSSRFRRNIAEYEMKPEHVTALRALPPLHMLVIAEDWCPDCYRGLPVLARICQVTGWEMRIFPRDDNNDLIAEFPNPTPDGPAESIPVSVFYTPDHREIGRWIERPAIANEYIAALDRSLSQAPDESDTDYDRRLSTAHHRVQRTPEWDRWRHATVDEIIALVQTRTAA